MLNLWLLNNRRYEIKMMIFYAEKRAGYLEKFSPGHFDLTFVLGQNGLNEDAIFLIDVSFCHTKESLLQSYIV